MILVDTSVWVDHLHGGDAKLFDLLDAKQVLTHDFVVGELAMGHLSDREMAIRSLLSLRFAEMATHGEVLSLIEQHRLFGTGLGYVDVHILASAMLTSGCKLWTRDRRLNRAAGTFGLAAPDLD